MERTVDAVIIGSGINAMVAAAELGKAGWSVALVEQNAEIGGFIASGELTEPGYVHDTYSSWHPLFVSGAAYAALGDDLHAQGLEYCNTDGPLTGSISPDGRAAVAHRDPVATAAGFEHASDRINYSLMLEQMGSRAPVVFGALGAELRTKSAVGLAWNALRTFKLKGSESLARDALMSGRSFARERFRGEEADRLWAPWLLHAGLGPDSATGGMMFAIMALSMHGFGLPVVKGGAGNFVQAFRRVLEANGVEIATGTSVERIIVEGGRATGVETSSGRIRARRAVLAGTTPGALFRDLLPAVAVPTRTRSEAARYRYGRAAMQLHLALDAPLTFTDDRLNEAPLVHVSDGSGSTGIACAQAEAGLLPSAPTVVIGRQHLLDPTRVPEGKGSLWLQLQEVPFELRGDASGTVAGAEAGWSPDVVRAYVDRVLDRVQSVAPGLRDSILATEVITPQDLQAYNPNAVAGDPYAGSAEIDQNLLWRPLPSAGTHKTAVEGVWHLGASSHPGPGLGAGSGHLVATALLKTHRPRG
jgi:phytoene dehydrogenase-like protein